MHIPNKGPLFCGVLITIGLCVQTWLSIEDDGGIVVVIHGLLGIPVAFAFLMFSNPKEESGGAWGLAIALPFCALMWPLLVLSMLLSKPWKDPRWINRKRPNDPNQPEQQSK